MSLSGSIILIAYFIARPILTKYFPSKIRCNILKIAMLMYLLPINSICNLFTKYGYKEDVISVDLLKSVQISQKNIILFDTYNFVNIIKFILFLWILAMIYFSFKNIAHYIRLKKIFSIGTSDPDPLMIQLFSKIKMQYNIKPHIIIKKSRYISTPITFGFLKPIIMIPEIPMTEIELNMAISHELIHIKHHDIKIKFLCLLVMILHWFNPLCYFLCSEFNNVSEFFCDESVALNLSSNQKKIYGNLLLRLSDYKSFEKHIFILPLTKSNHILKERIVRLLQTKQYCKKHVFCSFVLLLFFGILGTSTAYATKVQIIVKNQPYFLNSSETIFSYAERNYAYSNKNDFSGVIDIQYYLEENGAYAMINKDKEEKSICVHSYEPRSLQKHTRYADGKCSMDTIDSQFCLKCNDLKIVSAPDHSFFYNNCPH